KITVPGAVATGSNTQLESSAFAALNKWIPSPPLRVLYCSVTNLNKLVDTWDSDRLDSNWMVFSPSSSLAIKQPAERTLRRSNHRWLYVTTNWFELLNASKTRRLA